MNLFQKLVLEAEGDEAPDLDMGSADTEPDDSMEMESNDDVPSDTGVDDGPPDVDNSFGDDDGMSDDSVDDGDPGEEDQQDNNQEEELALDEKVSAILNKNLYQEYLRLLNNVSTQLTSIKKNHEILNAISEQSISVVSQITKLEENIRLYLKNYFMTETYTKNLLFYNKSLNLLKMLNDVFDSYITKNINSVK